VGNFLVGVAVLQRFRLAAGEGDDRHPAEIGVLQPRGEVGGADRLREADARPAGDAGVAIGHVGDRLLAVAEHALDAKAAELDQGPAQDGVDEEDVRDAVGGEAAGQILGPGDRFRRGHACFPCYRGRHLTHV